MSRFYIFDVEDDDNYTNHSSYFLWLTIEEYAPKTGAVRLLRLTEKQYNNIYLVTGEPDYQEK